MYVQHYAGGLQIWYKLLYSATSTTSIFYLNSNNSSSGSYCSEKKRLFSQMVKLHEICVFYDYT